MVRLQSNCPGPWRSSGAVVEIWYLSNFQLFELRHERRRGRPASCVQRNAQLAEDLVKIVIVERRIAIEIDPHLIEKALAINDRTVATGSNVREREAAELQIDARDDIGADRQELHEHR